MTKRRKITKWEEAVLLFSDVREDIIIHCRQSPHSIKDLSSALKLNPGTIFNHIRKLHDAGFLEIVETRQVRGVQEKKYATTADFFDLSALPKKDLPKRNEKIAQDVKKKVKRLLSETDKASIKHTSVHLREEDLEYLRSELERLREFANQRQQPPTQKDAQRCTFLYALGGVSTHEED